MIYITGDIHGSIDIAKILPENWNESEKLTRSDYLIICGDFGFPFLPSDYSFEYTTDENALISRRTYEYWMNWMAKKRESW